MKDKIINWIKRQSFWSICSYITGILGFIIMIDGIFFVPLINTRYGFDNYSINTAMQFLLFSLIANVNHVVFKKRVE